MKEVKNTISIYSHGPSCRRRIGTIALRVYHARLRWCFHLNIYLLTCVVLLLLSVLHIFLAIWWQKRGEKTGAKELPTSTYGRPLVKKA